MALVWGDRTAETSTTTGTGAFTLAAAVTGYQRFSDVCATNDTIYYAIFAVDANGNPSGDWETGLGTYSSANTLTRTSVSQSTNSDNAVNFAAGTKWVIACPIALIQPTSFILTLLDDASAPAARTTLGADVYAFGLGFETAIPSASEVLLRHIVADAFTIPANFATPNSRGAIEINPTASFAIDVQRQVNATGAFATIGTITISTGGVFTFATSGGISKAIAANDVLKFIAPGVADATALGCAITIRGSR